MQNIQYAFGGSAGDLHRPNPSHVTEILDLLGDEYPSIRVAHGEAEILAGKIRSLRQQTAGNRLLLPQEATAAFSKDVLLPKLIGVLEDPRGN